MLYLRDAINPNCGPPFVPPRRCTDGDLARGIASQLLLSGVDIEKVDTNLGKKTAHYPKPVSL